MFFVKKLIILNEYRLFRPGGSYEISRLFRIGFENFSAFSWDMVSSPLIQAAGGLRDGRQRKGSCGLLLFYISVLQYAVRSPRECVDRGGSVKRVGIRMDALAQIIEDLNKNEELRNIFGEPVAGRLLVIAEFADGDVDLRIEENGDVGMGDTESRRFVEIIDRVVFTNLNRSQYSSGSN
ncbi:MAG: hypothetical protein PHU26_01975 [Methanofollis liminatans]|nr:hypothetical protein [Methanofollis liminatans]